MANAYGALAAPPALGYGNRAEASLDAVNQWMRAQPWYATALRAVGVDPAKPVNLSEYQKQAVLRAAQANGVVVDEGGDGQEIDDSGNFRAKGHKLKNTLIVAGIAAAALGTAGALGAFSAPALAGTTTAASPAAPAAAAAAGASAPAVAGAVGGATAALSPWLKTALSIGVPVAGNLIGAGIEANANSKAAELQAKGIADALEFEKKAYGDLTGRLDPYIQSGTTANDRMAQLLGLPARAGTTATGLPTRGPSVGNYRDPLNDAGSLPAADKARIDALLQKYNSGDTPEYWYGVTAQHGGFDKTGAEWLEGRIKVGDNAGKGYKGQPVARSPEPATAATPAAAPAAQEMVTVQAPSGETRSVPKAQADYWLGRGAKLVGAAA